MVANLKDVPVSRPEKRKTENVFVVAGEEDNLLKRTQTANSFHALAQLRTREQSPVKKQKTNWLVIFLCLIAGLVIGAELSFYLSKGVLLTK